MTSQYDETEYYFRKEFSKDLTPAERQTLRVRYGNFLQDQRMCNDTAIRRYLEGLNRNGTKVGENEMYGKREKVQELIGQAVDHLKTADEINGNLPHACSYLSCLYAQA
ncbi:hypothetical protein HPG69_019555, partial [Diceros bicornis minor]